MTGLIKTVRGLDQSGPGDNGEGLETLWSSLAASIDNDFHAAEESTLRWLLKSMNGSSAPAETMRRYPLTWTILDWVFQRIPLFSLAKSLADRRFIAVLQQTLKDVAKPSKTPTASPAKRKKTPGLKYELAELQTQPACLESATAVFKTLKSLLDRLDHAKAAQARRDTLGAEHVRSLFCSSATEAVGLVAPALTICGQALTCSIGDTQGASLWIDTISRIWDLHLQGHDDTSQVAIHLFQPAALISARIGSFPSAHAVEVPDSVKTRWSSDIQRFMHRNFIVPGRTDFIQSRTREAFDQALEVAKAIVHLSAPALYFFCCSVSGQSTDGELRKDNVEWFKQMFKLIEQALRERQDRIVLMKTILDMAIEWSTPIDVDDLRRICRDYAPSDTTTDWELVAKLAACDSDVFQVSDDAVALRGEICKRILKEKAEDHEQDSIAKLLGSIMDGFRTRRDFGGFLKLWLEQLCRAERLETDQRSPWLSVGQASSPTKAVASLVETELTPSQLVDIITWAAEKKPKEYPQSVCVFAAAITRAVRRDAFIDAVGRRLYDLVAPISGSTQTSALKWRVVSDTLTWVSPAEKIEVWDFVKSRLRKILKTSAVASGEAFEAFKCCLCAWDSLSLSDEHKDEAASLVERFTERFVTEMTSDETRLMKQMSLAKPDLHAELGKDHIYQQYLEWYLCGSSRFNKLYFEKKATVPPMLSSALIARKDAERKAGSLWRAFLRNDVNLNEPHIARETIDRLIAMLHETSGDQPHSEEADLYMKLLLSVPTEIFSRAQREKAMTILMKQQRRLETTLSKISASSCRYMLSLITKIMGRPTFYDDMVFEDLGCLANVTADACCSAAPESSEVLLELIERFSIATTSIVRQMAANTDERNVGYFRPVLEFANAFSKTFDASGDFLARRPLFLTQMKALVAELSPASHWQSHTEMGLLASDVRKALAICVADTVDKYVKESKSSASPDAGLTLRLLAAIDAASVMEDLASQACFEPSAVKKLEKRSRKMMTAGSMVGWKIQIFLRTHLSMSVELTQLTTFDDLKDLPQGLRQPLLRELVLAITKYMRGPARGQYLQELIDVYLADNLTSGQILAIQTVVEQLIDASDFNEQEGDFTLAAAHNQLILALLRHPNHRLHICRVLQMLLEKRPQAMSQWGIELTLSTVCDLCSKRADRSAATNEVSETPFMALCKLVEAVIKKHRVRLEGHYHLLLSTMQALLRNLVVSQVSSVSGEERCQESMAQAFGRLISLICEPTAGAVSRSQLHGALDSATDAAKRSAGRHMYLVLTQYVKLQLEETVPRVVREALEPGMNTIFDITPPEGRKILNDAMDSSGRAILREMFKRYVKFGKWSGV